MFSGTIMANQMMTCEQAVSLGLIRHDENEYFKDLNENLVGPTFSRTSVKVLTAPTHR